MYPTLYPTMSPTYCGKASKSWWYRNHGRELNWWSSKSVACDSGPRSGWSGPSWHSRDGGRRDLNSRSGAGRRSLERIKKGGKRKKARSRVTPEDEFKPDTMKTSRRKIR